ncbi:MAG: Endoglucanase, partial [Verrucomicrobiales bacterium]|nr:Endoglucanase [Verrucomicrobiales bacterium]
MDGGIDPSDLGKGEWLWQISNCTNKMKGQEPSVVNIPTMMDFLSAKGFRFIIVKAGTGSTNFPSAGNRQFNTNLVNAAHAVGIKIFGYTRSYGSDIAGESALADYVLNCGADGFVLDAEAEWESNKSWITTNGPALAWKLCGMIKTNWPNKLLAHAPLPIISGHTSFPYKEFGYWCDSVMPQDYWGYWGKTATAGVDWMDSEWRPFQNGLGGIWTNAIKPLAPVGQADNASQTAASIAEFFSYLKTDPNCVTTTGYKGCSFWDAEEHYASSWDAIGAGSIGSSNIAPWMGTQPQSQTVQVGQTANFVIAAGGLPAPLYRWQFNRIDIPGATNSSCAQTNVQLSSAGCYSVILTNTMGQLISSNAILTVDTNISFTLVVTGGTGGVVGLSPNQNNYLSNSVVILTATANAGYAFTGWSGDVIGHSNTLSVIMDTNKGVVANFVGLDGGGAILMVESRAGGSNYSYYSDSSFSDSTLKSSAVGCSAQTLGSRYGYSSACAITTTPVLPIAGGTYALEISHGSATSISKTVMVDAAVQGGAFLNPDGSTASHLWTTAFQQTNPNLWKLLGVIVLNPAVSQPTFHFTTTNTDFSSSTSRFYSDAYRWTCLSKQPTISTQPRSQTVIEGGTAVFAIGALGADPLTYQWKLNGTNLSGATTDSYGVSNARAADAGSYAVMVSSAAGSVTTADAMLAVNIPPSILTQPQSSTSLVGANVTFMAVAQGTTPLTYQWRLNGANISAATQSAYSPTNVQIQDSGSYSVVIANVAGSVSSIDATLTVIPCAIHLLHVTGDSGGSIGLAWTADVGTAYNFQFKDNLSDAQWTTIASSNAASGTLTLTDLTANPKRFYRLKSDCAVSDTGGFVRLNLLGNSESFVSLPLVRPAMASATVNSIAGSSIAAMLQYPSSWSANQFVYSGTSQSNNYYARFVSGAAQGPIYPVIANGANTLTLDNSSNSLASVATGDQFVVEPYWTLNAVFPNGSGVNVSPTLGNRNTEVLIPDFTTSGINLSAAKIYFFHAGIWKQVGQGNADHGNDIIQPNTYFIVRHNVATNTTLTVSGVSDASDWTIPLRTCSGSAGVKQDNYIGLARPIAVSLDSSGL